MENNICFSVWYRGEQHQLSLLLLPWSYRYRLQVFENDELKMEIEPDEEGSYRVLDAGALEGKKQLIEKEYARLIFDAVLALLNE